MAVSASAVPVPRRTDRVFFGTMSIVILAIVFVGFMRTFYLASYFGRPALSPLRVAHGMAFTGWVVVFAMQTTLIATGRRDVHRKLGYAGAVLAATMVPLGLVLAIASARAGHAPPGLAPLEFLIIPVFDMLVFAPLVAAAVYYRNQAAMHKRLMLIATVSLLGAAMARVTGTPGPVGADLKRVYPGLRTPRRRPPRMGQPPPLRRAVGDRNPVDVVRRTDRLLRCAGFAARVWRHLRPPHPRERTSRLQVGRRTRRRLAGSPPGAAQVFALAGDRDITHELENVARTNAPAHPLTCALLSPSTAPAPRPRRSAATSPTPCPSCPASCDGSSGSTHRRDRADRNRGRSRRSRAGPCSAAARGRR